MYPQRTLRRCQPSDSSSGWHLLAPSVSRPREQTVVEGSDVSSLRRMVPPPRQRRAMALVAPSCEVRDLAIRFNPSCITRWHRFLADTSAPNAALRSRCRGVLASAPAFKDQATRGDRGNPHPSGRPVGPAQCPSAPNSRRDHPSNPASYPSPVNATDAVASQRPIPVRSST